MELSTITSLLIPAEIMHKLPISAEISKPSILRDT